MDQRARANSTAGEYGVGNSVGFGGDGNDWGRCRPNNGDVERAVGLGVHRLRHRRRTASQFVFSRPNTHVGFAWVVGMPIWDGTGAR